MGAEDLLVADELLLEQQKVLDPLQLQQPQLALGGGVHLRDAHGRGGPLAPAAPPAPVVFAVRSSWVGDGIGEIGIGGGITTVCVLHTTAHTHTYRTAGRGSNFFFLAWSSFLFWSPCPGCGTQRIHTAVVRSGVSQSVKQGRALGRHPPSQSRSIVDPVRILHHLTCPPGGGMPPGVPCPMALAAWPV